VRKRSADALSLFAAACRDGSAKGCAMSAVVHAGANEDAKAERQAASDFEAACALGDPSGCVGHALMEAEGLGTYRDEETAAAALDEACGKGVAIACADLAGMAGRGGDGARARTLTARACALGMKRACPTLEGPR
jgi:TPR repeat protein